jgi:beta-glucosidase
MMNLARAAGGGRNWEGFGGDPFLSGVGAALTTEGMQSQGVIACAKHFVGNEQEHMRGGGGGSYFVSKNLVSSDLAMKRYRFGGCSIILV